MCHSNETRSPIANPPNSVQLEGTPTIPSSYIRVRAVVWECGDWQTHTQTDRHTDTLDQRTSTTHVKCNNEVIYIYIYLGVVDCIHVVMRVNLIVTLGSRGRSGEREKRKDQLLTLQRSKQKRTDAEMTSIWKVCHSCLRFIFFTYDLEFTSGITIHCIT